MLFLIRCSSLAYLCLSAQVSSCCGVKAGHAGLKLQIANVLNINLWSLCLSNTLFSILITKLLLVGVVSCSIPYEGVAVSPENTSELYYMLAIGYVSFEPKYFRNVKKRVLHTDIQRQLTMKTFTDVRQGNGKAFFVCTSQSSCHQLSLFNSQILKN